MDAVPTPPNLDRDWQIRLAAMNALAGLSDRSGGRITRDQMNAGFEFEGNRIPFANAQVGIWRPQALQKPPGIALSLTTAAVKKGVTPRYDDGIGSEGWFEYRYQGTDPNHWHNRAVRAAFESRRPLIYFFGIVPGVYNAVFPAYVVADDPSRLTFSIAADASGLSGDSLASGGSPEALKAYCTRTVKQRLHQRRFRELVVAAYRRKCTICTLGDNDRLLRLLDAAHILPDHDKRGLPEIPNGLSLCKIHHSAYDLNILGISPDYLIHINREILEEHDGPMLQFGIQKMEGRSLLLPSHRAHHPNKDYLAERFEEFTRAA